MENQVNTGTLETLTPGNSLLVQAREVANGKVQLEIAEPLATSGTASPLGMFNTSDERFSGSKARRAWLTVEPADAERLLNIKSTDANGVQTAVDLSTGFSPNDRGHSVKDLNVLNPELESGDILRVQISETISPTEYQTLNLETSAKRKGKDGEFITNGGMYIFANTDVIIGEPVNTFLEPDTSGVSSELQGILATNNVVIETGEILS
jgi:hypothetical protein